MRLLRKIDKGLLLTFLLSLLPLFSLFHPGMFAGHDSESHVARLVAFYQSISEGNIIPRWAANLNMGYGHPILMFLYPLSNYLGSFWHFLGFSFVTSVKMTFGVSYILSGIFMYLFITELFGKKAGFLASLVYLFAPYRFVDFYVRAALGEHLAFMTMPLVLWSVTKLIKSDNTLYIVLSSLSLALLILSHNAIALMFLPFFFLYLIIAVRFLNHQSYILYRVLTALLLGFGLSAFFWLPAWVEGKYTLRDIVTQNDYANRFPSFLSLFYSPWSFGGTDFLSKEVGIAQWITVVAGLIYLARSVVIPNLIRDAVSTFIFWFITVSELYYWLVFFLLNKISLPIWQALTILQKFQFPWRFLSLSVLTSSLLGVSFLLLFKKKTYQITVITIIIFITIISTVSFWQPRGYLSQNDQFFISDYSGTTDTGESSPLWSIRGMEQKPKESLEIIDGQSSIKKISRNSTRHIYEVTASKTTRFVDNTVYFPGWEVLIDGVKTNIEFQDQNYRGLVTFSVSKGKHQIMVKFGETKLRLAADYLSLGALVMVFGILVVPYAFRRSGHV
ncbi:glycosyltransferase family 39 protein [Candidatus Roizmanbacteria bacterium]|nr:glycosyltransferase family 39 protein [Candidatus Roizmanbacteria bacterium]